MINTRGSEVIEKLFYNELKDLIDKYNNMSNESIEVLDYIFSKIEDEETKQYFLNSRSKLDEVIKRYKEDSRLNVNEIIFYSWFNRYIEEISLDKVLVHYNQLISDKYIEIGEYLIFRDKEDLKEYTKEKLYDYLDDSYHINRLLDKDAVIEMWLEGTSKEELLDEIISTTEIDDILDLSYEYAFKLDNQVEYKYAYIEDQN